MNQNSALDPLAREGGHPLELVCHRSLASAEPVWRAFERTAWMSPYQTFDWMDAWQRHIGAAAGAEPLIVVGRSHGDTAIILPLCVSRSPIGTVGRWLGGTQVNYAMPLIRRDLVATLDADAVRTMLHRTARIAGGIDVFDLTNQPRAWWGMANPMTRLTARTAPSPSYTVTLRRDFDAFFAERRSRKARHGLRRKERRLAEAHGPVELRTASSMLEVARVRAAFFRQRARRFREIGVESVFDRAPERGLVTDLTERTVREERPLLRLDYLAVGDDIAAIYGGVVHAGRYASYINSIETTYAEFSPGDLLLAKLLQTCCEAGVRDFDLGIGDARYKQAWCDPDPLVDVTVPVTSRGQLLAAALTAPRTLHGTIKNNPALWRLARTVQRRVEGRRKNDFRPLPG